MEINQTLRKIGKWIAIIIAVSLVRVLVKEYFIYQNKNKQAPTIDVNEIKLENKFLENAIIPGPIGDKFKNENVKFDNPLYENIITDYNSYVLNSSDFHLMEFFYDYEFVNSKIEFNLDSGMSGAAQEIQKAFNYEFVEEEFSKEKYKTYRGVFKTKSNVINFVFVSEKRGNHVGIIGTITPIAYSKIQEQVIDGISFLYPFEKMEYLPPIK